MVFLPFWKEHYMVNELDSVSTFLYNALFISPAAKVGTKAVHFFVARTRTKDIFYAKNCDYRTRRAYQVL